MTVHRLVSVRLSLSLSLWVSLNSSLSARPPTRLPVCLTMCLPACPSLTVVISVVLLQASEAAHEQLVHHVPQEEHLFAHTQQHTPHTTHHNNTQPREGGERKQRESRRVSAKRHKKIKSLLIFQFVFLGSNQATRPHQRGAGRGSAPPAPQHGVCCGDTPPNTPTRSEPRQSCLALPMGPTVTI